MSLATGTIRAKDTAADWVRPRLPAEHRPVLARARAVYLGDRDERWDDDLLPGARPCADFLAAAIDRQRASYGLPNPHA
ncbi:aminoglycoside adenylyltransferase domain-containing protein [Streptomyces sp. DT2A-34]|uniref:aminoglycoside adenylyltransferase domain-containing protein n=1 Tax=Streptomyces sp. DT2A-34 TaxID=3051182 RepID=UPI003463A68E